MLCFLRSACDWDTLAGSTDTADDAYYLSSAFEDTNLEFDYSRTGGYKTNLDGDSCRFVLHMSGVGLFCNMRSRLLMLRFREGFQARHPDGLAACHPRTQLGLFCNLLI